MLKKRITAVVVVRNGITVQSVNFRKYLPVGKPEIAVEFLDNWGIDEIVLLDITASKEGRSPDYDMVRRVSGNCRVPLSVGGGISGISDIDTLMHCGADKVVLNHAAIARPDLITEAAGIFGDQCVVVSIDSKWLGDRYAVYDHVKGGDTEFEVPAFAARCERLGAGELFINSVDRDGSYAGYDIQLVRSVCSNVHIPVICCGGAASGQDMVNVFEETSVSAAAAANFFHFYEHSATIAKSTVGSAVDIRLESHADYTGCHLDPRGRLLKKDDRVLEEMLFEKIEREVI